MSLRKEYIHKGKDAHNTRGRSQGERRPSTRGGCVYRKREECPQKRGTSIKMMECPWREGASGRVEGTVLKRRNVNKVDGDVPHGAGVWGEGAVRSGSGGGRTARAGGRGILPGLCVWVSGSGWGGGGGRRLPPSHPRSNHDFPSHLEAILHRHQPQTTPHHTLRITSLALKLYIYTLASVLISQII